MTSWHEALDYPPSHLFEWLVGIALVAVSAVAAWLGSYPVMSTAQAHAGIYRQLEWGMPQEEASQIASALGQGRQQMPPDADPGQPVPDPYTYPFYRPLYASSLRLGFIDRELAEKEVWTPDSRLPEEAILNPHYSGLFTFDFFLFALPLACLAFAAGVFNTAWRLGVLKRWGLAVGGLVCWVLLVWPFSPLFGLVVYHLSNKP